MKLYEANGVKYFKFDNIEKTGIVNHCFSTRIGGVSENEFESLNLAFNKGDKRALVEENFKCICEANAMDYRKMVLGQQVHDNKIMTVTMDNAGCGITFESQINGFDGFMTNEKEVVLVTFHADCVPLFFVDPINKAIALSHSGWKGTVKKIAKETVKRMAETYNTDPKDIQAAIGPSIGRCCFQVDQPVVDEFKRNIDFAQTYIFDDPLQEGKYNIDLWAMNRDLMLESGVLAENIEITHECTMCNPGLFFSHRVMGEKRGSLAAFISLKA